MIEQQAVNGGGGGGTSCTVAEAAQRIGVSERTVRDWIRLGKVSADRVTQTPRGTLLSWALVEELRQARPSVSSTGDVSLDGGGSSGSGGTTMAAAAAAAEDVDHGLHSRRDGSSSSSGSGGTTMAAAAAAAEDVDHGLHSRRDGSSSSSGSGGGSELTELRARLEGYRVATKIHAQRRREEGALLRADVSFLRAHLQQARDSERELRLLLAQTTKMLQQATEKPALPSSSEGMKPSRGRVRWWNPATWRG
jgi:excisionase family DNA binding protein